MPGADTRSVLARFCNNNWKKGKDFVKLTLSCQKTCVGDGGELKRASRWRVLDLGKGTIMLRKVH